MKITIFNSSPRTDRGNTHAIASEFMAGARDAGAEVENVFLARCTIKPCQGCFACWKVTPGVCSIKDDVAPLLDKLRNSDVVVFATPLYVDNVSGIMKLFMDRLIPLADPHFSKDEHGECRHPSRNPQHIPNIVVISNSGFPEQSHFQVLRLLFRRISANLHSKVVGEIYRGAGEMFSSKNPLAAFLLRPYRKLLRKAGRELVQTGQISDQTAAALEKPIISDALYIRNANKNFDKALRKIDR
ncbi:MAG TPA: flavodoxin family protein [Candidatus Bathyarchaeia archaeon]|nr:flavodoxin family protein [Candidatus Bathyarchaeia archaeon]